MPLLLARLIFPPFYFRCLKFEEELAAGGVADYKIMKMNGLNHLLQECSTGLISEYYEIEQTISPSILEIIKSWILFTD
ncbi:MAG TPA: hypothetical protein DEQ09_06465 [Bacteroidales bacterium]|nr:hypothetical protein [Bacteroidales bacterium]